MRVDDDVRSTASRQSTAVDRVAGLYVTGANGQPGVLVASAGRDVNLIGSTISNASEGGVTYVAAERDVNLRTLATSSGNSTVVDARNYQRQSQSGEVGSTIEGAGDVHLSAGRDITARQANVQAGGALTARAGNDVTIESGEARQSSDIAGHSESSGFLSSGSNTYRFSSASTDVVGSNFGGKTVVLSSGNDLSIKGSNVVSDQGTTLVAGNNVSITAAQGSYEESNFHEEKKSGLMGSGLGFTIGRREQSGNGTASGTTAVGSTVGAIDGNVTIVAGNQYTQTGSDVIAPGGDVSIRARSVAITEARETSRSQSEQHASQSGLSVGLSSPTLSAAQGALGTVRAMGNTSDDRMQALGAATLALQGNQLANSLNAAQAPGGNAADQAGGINLNISLGSSRSDSQSSSQGDTARGSTVQAGGNVSIVATGGGQDSNLLIQGSDITAGNRASLYADNQITLRAADNTSSQDSSNSASSGSIGVSIGLGNAGGVSLNASGSRASGSGNGSDQWASNTHISGGNRVDIYSGGNTTLDGAVVAGNRVTADIRGDLLIGSRQDTSNYTSQQSSSGASLSVSPTGVPTGGSLSSGGSNLDSSYRSVGETSGIKAGDAGFDVNVQGRTTLNGGVITSTDTAVNERRNGFVPKGGVTVPTSDKSTPPPQKKANAGVPTAPAGWQATRSSGD